jgi:hypothetical protein
VARSEAQKRATRKLVAWNRSHRGGKRGGSRRASSGRREAPRKKSKTEHVGDAVAGLAIGGGLLAPAGFKAANADTSPPVELIRRDSLTNIANNLKANVPLVGKDPDHAYNRYAVGAGILVKAAPEARKLPGLLGKAARKLTTLKWGRKRYVLGG